MRPIDDGRRWRPRPVSDIAAADFDAILVAGGQGPDVSLLKKPSIYMPNSWHPIGVVARLRHARWKSNHRPAEFLRRGNGAAAA